MDGGAAALTKVQEGVQAAEKLTPLAAQYPMAFALLVVAVFAVGCIFIFYRRDKDRSVELSAMVEVNRDQAATLETMSSQLDSLIPILMTLSVVAQVLKLNEADLANALAKAKSAEDELKSRRKRSTGAITAMPLPPGGPGKGGA